MRSERIDGVAVHATFILRMNVQSGFEPHYGVAVF